MKFFDYKTIAMTGFERPGTSYLMRHETVRDGKFSDWKRY